MARYHTVELTSLPRIGSPANAMARLQPWSIHQGLNVQPVNSSRWITTDLWSVIHKEALSQCDELDGVSRIEVDEVQRFLTSLAGVMLAFAAGQGRCHFQPSSLQVGLRKEPIRGADNSFLFIVSSRSCSLVDKAATPVNVSTSINLMLYESFTATIWMLTRIGFSPDMCLEES